VKDEPLLMLMLDHLKYLFRFKLLHRYDILSLFNKRA
jgi:ATP:corrinoid adenosyltransferase